MSKSIYSLGLTVVFLLMSSCTEFIKSIEDTKKGKDMETENLPQHLPEKQENTTAIDPPIFSKKERGFAADKQHLHEVEVALRQLPQFENKPIYVYQSIHFYDNYRVLLQVQNPDNPDYVDEYYYANGQWHEPKPIVLSKNAKIEQDLVSLDEIPFVNANNVYEALKQKVEEIGGDSSDLTVYVITRKNRVRWYPRTVSNDRSRYAIEFNKDGTLLSFEQE